TYCNYTNYGSLIEMFQDRVSHYGDKICIRYQNQQHFNNTTSSVEFETLTFNQVDMISTYFAEEWGSELTDVSCVAYILDDPVVSLLTILAILKLRRTVFPISTRNSESAIVHLLEKTQTGYLITSEKYRHIAQKCRATTAAQQQEDTSNNMDNKSEIGLRVLPLFSKDMVLNLAFQHSSINNNKNNIYSKATTTKRTIEQQHKDIIIIIHTSGTMTFPKPIYHSNQLLLFTVLDLLGSHFSKANPPLNNLDVVMLTFPLFHGHGIMSLFTIMSLGATAVLFRRLPPLARDTLSVIKKYNVTVMTLPPIQLEDLATYIQNQEQDNRNKGAIAYNITEIFQQIKYCTYTGAPLRIEVGEYLHSKGLNVRNGYGSSETGFVGGPDLSRDNKQWYNMNISTSPITPYIYWEPINDNQKNKPKRKPLITSSTLTSSEVYQLTFKSNYPALGSNVTNRPDGGYATGDLFIEDPPNSKTWRHVGRIDDTLVMKNGEKTNPNPMESEINKSHLVKNCMVVGENRECTAALIELAVDEAIKYSPMEIISEVYKSVQQANVMAPSHSAIMIPQMVYILPLNKTLVTTFKGTISRQKTIQCFEEEIEQMYSLFLQNSVFNATTASGASVAMGDSTPVHENNVDRKKELTKEQQEDVKAFLCQAVYQVLSCPMDEVDLTTPLFDYGLDSLLAIQLRNIIASRFSCVSPITNFCFEYPTIESMVQMLTDSSATTITTTDDSHGNQEKNNSDVVADENNRRQQEKRYQETQSILHGYFARIESDFPTKAPNPPVVMMDNDNSNIQQQQQQTVLLTGATGSLGSFLLQAMIESPQIKKIYCLVRNSRSNKDQDSKQQLEKRIIKAFQDRHIALPDNFYNKVQVLPMNLNAPYLGLENEAVYTKLQDEVTIIQCCGWLLDFNHTIQHFDRECIQGLYNLIKFAYRGTTRQPIHIHVVSSISATASLAQFLQQNQKQQNNSSNNSSNDNNYDTSNYYIVPERASPQDPHVALPMGYAQSKYIVEHMFSYLAEYKNMPCFVERMGQLIGDTNNGAWNTSEHYPLMMIGGATMKMMPDRACSLPTLDWIPVDSAATAILEIMMHYVSSSSSSSFLPSHVLMADHYSLTTRFTVRETASVRRRSVYHHIVNPNYITWSDMLQAMADCGIQFDVVEPDVWVDELRKHQDNSAYRLLSYFETNWITSSSADRCNSKMTLWDTEDTIKIAPSLINAPVFDARLLKKCLSSWNKIGFYV
ncbi:hypothetical protein INT45_005032, partial [Circinella minor]